MSGVSIGGYSTGESDLGGGFDMAPQKSMMKNKLSSMQILSHVDNIVEQRFEEDDFEHPMEIEQVPKNCKDFMKS